MYGGWIRKNPSPLRKPEYKMVVVIGLIWIPAFADVTEKEMIRFLRRHQFLACL
jgi:hypothetical protein